MNVGGVELLLSEPDSPGVDSEELLELTLLPEGSEETELPLVCDVPAEESEDCDCELTEDGLESDPEKELPEFEVPLKEDVSSWLDDPEPPELSLVCEVSLESEVGDWELMDAELEELVSDSAEVGTSSSKYASPPFCGDRLELTLTVMGQHFSPSGEFPK